MGSVWFLHGLWWSHLALSASRWSVKVIKLSTMSARQSKKVTWYLGYDHQPPLLQIRIQHQFLLLIIVSKKSSLQNKTSKKRLAIVKTTNIISQSACRSIKTSRLTSGCVLRNARAQMFQRKNNGSTWLKRTWIASIVPRVPLISLEDITVTLTALREHRMKRHKNWSTKPVLILTQTHQAILPQMTYVKQQRNSFSSQKMSKIDLTLMKY